jgi:immune inhibitor A
LSEHSKRRRAQTALATVAVGGLLAAGLSATATQTAVASSPVADSADLQETYINYVAPQVEQVSGREKVNKKAFSEALELDRKHAGGNPVAARALAKTERKAIKTGLNPSEFKQAPETQQARLLTILVEFDPTKTYDWSGVMVPKTVFGDRTCVDATDVPNGPLHNNIPNPANYATTPGSAPDNNSFWVNDFSPQHFDDMLYTDTGITERVRKDLKGPDGKPGIDISGYTMKNMYEEMSKGAYTVDGEATNWVQVDNSEAYYAADTCTQDEEGVWDAGREQDMNGHPSNPRGPGQLAIDAVQALAAQQPDFPFADYDLEDQGDLDNDGNVYEPDGVIDHVVLVHAGKDKSGGGGAEGTYAIWAHSSSVPGGQTIPGTGGLKLSNYIVQPEDSGVGVFAHEYGHDLGLPDLYDTTGGGESDIDFWDLMSSGSHSGPIFQSIPAHMGIWDKWVLGWADPLEFNPGDAAKNVQLGQTSRTPNGSEDGIKVNLPQKVTTLATPHSGANMWWSGNDQDWADNRLTRTVEVPAGSDVRFSMWNDYVIEEDWDFGFVEVSTDGGTTWTEQKVYDTAGAEVTTPDGYADPNGRMADYGNKKYGLTGATDGMEEQHIDLTPFAGQTIQVRLRYATDEAFVERGWFADDFAVTNGATTVWSDDVEGGTKDWTTTIGTFVPGTPLGGGWRIDTGTASSNQYYMAEWRNFDGFDKGLQYAYDTTYSDFGPWKVEKIKYNAPGMLVWYRDVSYGDQNPVTATTFDLPSTGSKGGLLLVDSHFDPLRRAGVAADKDPSTLNNLASRPQSSNVAFNLATIGPSTYPFKECLAEVPGEDWRNEYCTSFRGLPAVNKFTDAKGWYPGIEVRGESLFFRDIDASTVVPNRNNEPYSVRVVDQNGNPMPELYGEDIGVGVPLGTGNPTKPFGVSLTVESTSHQNMVARIKVQPAQ